MVSQIPSRIPGVQPFDLGFLAGGLLVLLLVLILFAIVVRKFLRRGDASPEGQFTAPVPDPENASAFMAASMQAVIQKLRDQEKELAANSLSAPGMLDSSDRNRRPKRRYCLALRRMLQAFPECRAPRVISCRSYVR